MDSISLCLKDCSCLCSSKDIVKPLFHVGSLNVKQLLTTAKPRKVSRATLPLF